jgi:SAM-dependent methyltransferase
MNKDLFGRALLDFWNNNYTEDLVTWTSISDKDTLPVPYLFRSFKEMPHLEQTALKMAKGSVLDVGCGAGSHTLWLQEQGFKVKGIDISAGAVEVSKNRGVKKVVHQSLLEETERFDTVLMLMNGTGIFDGYSNLKPHLLHLKTILKPQGQVLIDSSDIIYMYEDEQDDGTWLDLNADYYGNLDYYLSYKGKEETPFKWLYLDFERLFETCQSAGLKCEKVMDGNHYDYLARIFI